MSGIDVLILAPYAPELEGLHSLLGKNLSTTVGSLEVKAKTIGIGLPMAAAGAADKLVSLQPRVAILLATCASFPDRGYAPGQVAVAERFVLADAAVLDGRGSFPDPMTCVLEPSKVVSNALAMSANPMVAVACPLSVTNDIALAHRMSTQLDCEVLHSEAFGFASACAQHGVPFAAVLGISNEIGPDARDTWRRYHRAAGHNAAQVVTAWLQSGGAGIPHESR